MLKPSSNIHVKSLFSNVERISFLKSYIKHHSNDFIIVTNSKSEVALLNELLFFDSNRYAIQKIRFIKFIVKYITLIPAYPHLNSFLDAVYCILNERSDSKVFNNFTSNIQEFNRDNIQKRLNNDILDKMKSLESFKIKHTQSISQHLSTHLDACMAITQDEEIPKILMHIASKFNESPEAQYTPLQYRKLIIDHSHQILSFNFTKILAYQDMQTSIKIFNMKHIIIDNFDASQIINLLIQLSNCDIHSHQKIIILKNSKDKINVIPHHFNIISEKNIKNDLKYINAPQIKISQDIHSISPTGMKLLIMNPYLYYLQNILKLRSYTTIDTENLIFGIKLHEVIAKVSKINQEEDIYVKNFLSIFHDVCKDFQGMKPEDKIIIKIAQNLYQRQKDAKYSIIEQKFCTTLECGITLEARIDKIEISQNGILTILDYKTGLLPTNQQILNGEEPQLLIEALIVQKNLKDILKCFDIKFSKEKHYLQKICYLQINKINGSLKEHEVKFNTVEIEKNISIIHKHLEEMSFFYSSKDFPLFCKDFHHVARKNQWN